MVSPSIQVGTLNLSAEADGPSLGIWIRPRTLGAPGLLHLETWESDNSRSPTSSPSTIRCSLTARAGRRGEASVHRDCRQITNRRLEKQHTAILRVVSETPQDLFIRQRPNPTPLTAQVLWLRFAHHFPQPVHTGRRPCCANNVAKLRLAPAMPLTLLFRRLCV